MTREYVENPKLDGKELCALIVEVFHPEKDGKPLTPEEVWNWSPTGELSHVFTYGLDAYAIKHGLKTEIDWSPGPNRGSIRFYREVE